VNFVVANNNEWGDGLGSLQTEDQLGVTASSCYKIVAKAGDEANEQKRDLVAIDCPATALETLPVAAFRVEDGTVYANGEMRIYTVTGQDVTPMNGRLNGLYIVTVNGRAARVNIQ
ncbi:MAG: hypothetical protein IJV55_07365, partial [Paludibacteraceae bacterium]|nr:hypothetical protein [Paludibacteraceae bacterium]